MNTYDVIVIGAGPGGSFFAENMAKNKLNILMLDKERFPRNKLCAGWITGQVLKTLEISKDDYPHKIEVLDNINFWIDNKQYSIKHKNVKNFAVLRKEFDDYLVKRAVNAGAGFKQNTLVKGIEFRKEFVIVKTNKNDFKAKIVVGAGGSFCPLYLKFNKGLKENTIVCLEYQKKVKNPLNKSANILLENDLGGYAWCFTKKNHLNIGIGRMNEKNILKHKDEFIKTLKKLDLIPANIKMKFNGCIYRVNDNKKRIISGNRFLLIGDSAGLANRINGEGIGPALCSAKMASDYVIKCLKKREYNLSGISNAGLFKVKTNIKFPTWFLNFLISFKFIKIPLFKKIYKEMFLKRRKY